MVEERWDGWWRLTGGGEGVSFVVIPLLEGWHLALHTALLCELGAGSIPGRLLHCICGLAFDLHLQRWGGSSSPWQWAAVMSSGLIYLLTMILSSTRSYCHSGWGLDSDSNETSIFKSWCVFLFFLWWIDIVINRVYAINQAYPLISTK